MAFAARDMQRFLQALKEDPESRAELRSLLLSEDVQTLPGRFDRLTEIVGQLAEAQQRSEERLTRLEATVERLAEAQQRTEERLERLIERVDALTEEVRALVSWQRGESGRREGERYERTIQKRAPALFVGGEGGATDQRIVQQRLTKLLVTVPAFASLTDEEDPFLADLIWWKDDQFVVVEASIQVDNRDVVRAAKRAETLRKANVQAMGVVIGEGWAATDTREQAETRGVHWKVGDDLSEGLLAFRTVTAS